VKNKMSTLLLLLTFQQAPVVIRQTTSGWCSPAIANVIGNVTVNCIGVDPRALGRLNERLSRKNTELSDKIREANEWAERYHELETRLANSGDEMELSHQAEEYLHAGELEKAGEVLDQILNKEEKEEDLVAANHYNRALVFELQFRPVDALPHLAKAYQYRPEQLKYGQAYGNLLLAQNDYGDAETILKAILDRGRQLAKSNPAAYQPDVARTLNNLALLYNRTQRLKEAEAAFQDALDLFRELSKSNSAAYQPDAAATLNNLANLYRQTQRLKEAEAAYDEALEVYRQLANSDPAAYRSYVAVTLNNLANLYRQTQRLKEAEAAFQEALDIRRQLAKSNPAAYQPDVAQTLNNLANLYSHTQRLKEAEAAYQEALDIRRQLAKSNPAAY
jgi:tetratricopeptide (TPR) repeat protein